MNFVLLLLFFFVTILPLKAQYVMGTTGGLNIPTADMQADGTVMAGINYLPQQLMPPSWDYNTGNYFVNITFLPFVEVAYRCTLLKGEFKADNRWQQDRSVSLRLRPVKEGRWCPSVVVGSGDAFTTGQLNMFGAVKGNRFFSSVYGVVTKHLVVAGHELGFSTGGNIPFRRDSYKQGLFGGISYRPGFFRSALLMVEYDTTEAVNVGWSCLLFNHFSVYAFCYDFRAAAGGVRYEFHCDFFKKNDNSILY